MSRIKRARTRWRENRSVLWTAILRLLIIIFVLFAVAFCVYMAGK